MSRFLPTLYLFKVNKFQLNLIFETFYTLHHIIFLTDMITKEFGSMLYYNVVIFKLMNIIYYYFLYFW